MSEEYDDLDDEIWSDARELEDEIDELHNNNNNNNDLIIDDEMKELDIDIDDIEPSLQNILDKNTLKWIFVGGKGGVGKTTISCSLGVQLSRVRESVLILSTDPAHNLSDAFGQKFSKEPILVKGFDNLYCMETDPNQAENLDQIMSQVDEETAKSGIFSVIHETLQNIPGADETLGFTELMRQIQSMKYSCVVFDTAPTGHTLRLLSWPTLLKTSLTKIMGLKDQFSGIFSQAMNMMGGGSNNNNGNNIMDNIQKMLLTADQVNEQFRNDDLTTFVSVCIPEFLSLYENERLVQELSKYGINIQNIVINQVLFPDKDSEDMFHWYDNTKDNLPKEASDIISKTIARKKMQDKYISQFFELYETFHIILMPLLDYEVRGKDRIENFSDGLMTGEY